MSTTSAESHDDDEGDWESGASRRKKQKIRQRERSQQLQQQSAADRSGGAMGSNLSTRPKVKPKPAEISAVHQRNAKLRRQPLAVGKCTQDCDVAAAREFKQVFCVDNVSLSVHEPQLAAFVAGLGIRVYSCHEVTARLNAWQRKNCNKPSHRTFRLCINRGDAHLLLNADTLPSDIMIAQWHFKHSRKPEVASTELAADGVATANEDNDETFVINDIDTAVGPIAAGTPSKQ
jgi:hypothetical protein